MENEILNPQAWRHRYPLQLAESSGLHRTHQIMEVPFDLPFTGAVRDARELRLARADGTGALRTVRAQFHPLRLTGGRASGTLTFFCDLKAGEECRLEVLIGNPVAEPPGPPPGLLHTAGTLGPQHRFIETEFYKVELLPKSGQIWHIWNKLGSNHSWHHYEWADNKDKGGDPCHWSPNCWMAYPERITSGPELAPAGENDFIDWHYVFGWDNPETEIVAGPLFLEIKRRGVVWPHPEHSLPNIKRDSLPRISAEVTYRFYAGSPFIYQASTTETLQDLGVFFIRNGQFVFLDHVFSHLLIASDDRGLLPGDQPGTACIRLMGPINNKPYDDIEHSLSNILPSSPAYYAYFNHRNADGFGLFPVREDNTNVLSGQPHFQNHSTQLSEIKGWAVYLSRTFSYVNQRFNPENVAIVPKGERYAEENYGLIYRHESYDRTSALLALENRKLRERPAARWLAP